MYRVKNGRKFFIKFKAGVFFNERKFKKKY